MKTGRSDLDARIRVSSIPVDEPTFLLRGQDAAAAATVRAWAALTFEAEGPAAVIEQALKQADAMEAWPVKKVADADHLAEADRQQLEYELSRRARLAPVSSAGEVLAYQRGFTEGGAKGRHARALLDRAWVLLSDEKPDLGRLGQLLEEARAQLVERP